MRNIQTGLTWMKQCSYAQRTALVDIDVHLIFLYCKCRDSACAKCGPPVEQWAWMLYTDVSVCTNSRHSCSGVPTRSAIIGFRGCGCNALLNTCSWMIRRYPLTFDTMKVDYKFEKLTDKRKVMISEDLVLYTLEKNGRAQNGVSNCQCCRFWHRNRSR